MVLPYPRLEPGSIVSSLGARHCLLLQAPAADGCLPDPAPVMLPGGPPFPFLPSARTIGTRETWSNEIPCRWAFVNDVLQSKPELQLDIVPFHWVVASLRYVASRWSSTQRLSK